MSGSSIFWIIVIGGLLYWMMKKGGCGMGHGGHGSGGGEGSGSEGSRMIKDPVCGMFLDPKTAINSRHMGQTFYFCSPACKDNFDKEPMKYIKNEKKNGGCCG